MRRVYGGWPRCLECDAANEPEQFFDKARIEARLSRYLENANKWTMTVDQWREMLQQCDYLCVKCHSFQASVDHIVARSMGGGNIIANIQPLCLPCNFEKGTKTEDYRPVSMKRWAHRAWLKLRRDNKTNKALP